MAPGQEVDQSRRGSTSYGCCPTIGWQDPSSRLCFEAASLRVCHRWGAQTVRNQLHFRTCPAYNLLHANWLLYLSDGKNAVRSKGWRTIRSNLLDVTIRGDAVCFGSNGTFSRATDMRVHLHGGQVFGGQPGVLANR